MPNDEYKVEFTGDASDLSQAAEQAGRGMDSMDRKTDRARQTTKQHRAAMQGLGEEIKSQALQYASFAAVIGTVTAAIRANTEEVKRNAEAANQQKKAQLDLQFLRQGYSAADLQVVEDAASIIGGPNAQVEAAGAFAQLRSQTSHLTDDQQVEFFRQMAETTLTTSAPIQDLVPLFARGSLYVSDPNRLQNIMRKTQELSPEASPRALAQLLPRVLPLAGEDTGLAPEQIAGLLVTSMNLSGTPEMGATGLRNILSIISGGAQGAGADVLARAGADRGDAMQRLAALAGEDLSVERRTQLFGRENLVVASGLLNNLDLARRNVAEVVGVGRSGRDLTAEAIDEIYGQDRQQALRLATAQAQARVERQKGADVRAQEAALGRLFFEERMRAKGTSAFRREANLTGYDIATGMGLSPENATWVAGMFFGLPREMAELYTQGGPDAISRGLQAGPQTNVNIIGQQVNSGSDPVTDDYGRTQR